MSKKTLLDKAAAVPNKKTAKLERDNVELKRKLKAQQILVDELSKHVEDLQRSRFSSLALGIRVACASFKSIGGIQSQADTLTDTTCSSFGLMDRSCRSMYRSSTGNLICRS